MSPTTRAAVRLFQTLDADDKLSAELRRFLVMCTREGFPPALVHIAAGTVCSEATALEVATKLMRLGARMRALDDSTVRDDPTGAELVRFLEHP